MNPEDGLNFNWFASYTHAAEMLPEDVRGEFLWGVVQYGTYGNEPFFGYPLDVAFELIRPNLDNSRKRSLGGKKGMKSRWGEKEE